MVKISIIIKNIAQTSTILESTRTIESGENFPRVFFSRNDWSFISKPNWKKNVAVQREGNFQYYSGSDNKEVDITLYLAGATRNDNLETIKDLKEPIYLDCDDINSNDSGNYVLTISDIKRNEDSKLITIKLKLESYNN